MTALSVVTVAFSNEGCVDEHMKQDGEVCIDPPLQRRLIVSIASWFVILVEARRSHSCSQLFSSCVSQMSLLTAMLEKTVFSTRSTVFDAWCGESITCCATQIFLHLHGQFSFESDEHDHCSTFPSCRQISSKFPKTLCKTPASHVPATRDVPQRSTMTPA